METNSFTKELSRSNIGSAGMHDRYITIPKSKINPEEFFGPPPKIIKFNDYCLGKKFEFPYKKEHNGEYRLTRFGDYLDEHNVNVDDEVCITKIEPDKYSINIYKKQQRNSILDFNYDSCYFGLLYSNQLITRYISSLVTKPFVLLSGLSGSGKTKLAQSFAQWICEDKTQYCIVPVGADWTNREPLLGYVNALDEKQYIVPENGALQLLIEANKEENKKKPYFLILDEMNLSHVERYFSDFLSVMESKDEFKLHSNKEEEISGVPYKLAWPKNLFVVGTVNIDETTYMFSPKVLDRANVIEFRVSKDEMESYLFHTKDVKDLNGEGKNMGESFVQIAKDNSKKDSEELSTALKSFFIELQNIGAEFGYRTASEIQTLFSKIDIINPEYSDKIDEKIDIAIMQKLLPKLHGSRRKLSSNLKVLAGLCVKQEFTTNYLKKEKNENEIFDVLYEYFDIIRDDEKKVLKDIAKADVLKTIKYPISLEKIVRMYRNAQENGFASYAEA